ncbi:MAG: MurR/RpiR family transcriptional regulator [Bacilli bacterium]|nr:MurR/RpiR family transcriptional regulator [Bacilli bacterium]
MTIENQVKAATHLTQLEKEIGAFVIQHKALVLKMNIDDFAKKLFVSKSAILRFCKKLELSGFKQLKIKLAQEAASINLDVDVNFPFTIQDQAEQIGVKMQRLYEEAINDTLQLIDKKQLNEIAEMIEKSIAIDIYTHAHNFSVARNFQDQLLSIGKNINCYQDAYNQRLCALHSNEQHLAIIISYSGKASFVESVVNKLIENNTPMVLISKMGGNDYSNVIKHQLFISDKENLQQRISQFSSHISLQFIMDVLYSCVFNQKPESNRSSLVDKIQYMDDRRL